jgi:hypothetical protein
MELESERVEGEGVAGNLGGSEALALAHPFWAEI